MTKMLQHLSDRYFNPALYDGVTVADDSLTVMLWNLSGQCVGYQRYNPGQPKRDVQDPGKQKYYSYITKPCASNTSELAVFGLETVTWTDSILFLTEGIFDCSRLHWHGLPAIAILGNNPKHLRAWLSTLPSQKIVCVQGDKAGQSLASYGDQAILLGEDKDVGNLSDEEFHFTFQKWLNV